MRIRREARKGTIARVTRCRQVKRGESSVTGGVVLTQLFHHNPGFGNPGSDLQVFVYPPLHLQAAIVGSIETHAVGVLVLARPANRGAHFETTSIQDGERKSYLHGVAEVEL